MYNCHTLNFITFVEVFNSSLIRLINDNSKLTNFEHCTNWKLLPRPGLISCDSLFLYNHLSRIWCTLKIHRISNYISSRCLDIPNSYVLQIYFQQSIANAVEFIGSVIQGISCTIWLWKQFSPGKCIYFIHFSIC